MTSAFEAADDTSDAAVTAFAQQLGILPDEDDDFRWIAEVGLRSPLPSRWTSHADAHTGCMYYIDHDRQVSSWENPLVPHLRRVVEIGRGYLQTRSETYFDEQKGLLWHQQKYDLDCWHGPFSDTGGRSYYVNATLGISSWNDPRVDAQYIFELASGLLSTLSEVLPSPLAGDISAEDQPWKADNGAEVLIVADDSEDRSEAGAKGNSRLQRGLTHSLKNWTMNHRKDEHKSVLEKMASAAEWIRSVRQEEEEAQRLQIERKVAARQQRCQAKVVEHVRRLPKPLVDTEAQRERSRSKGSVGYASLSDTPLGSPMGGSAGTIRLEEPFPPSPTHTVPPPPPPCFEGNPSDPPPRVEELAAFSTRSGSTKAGIGITEGSSLPGVLTNVDCVSAELPSRVEELKVHSGLSEGSNLPNAVTKPNSASAEMSPHMEKLGLLANTASRGVTEGSCLATVITTEETEDQRSRAPPTRPLATQEKRSRFSALVAAAESSKKQVGKQLPPLREMGNLSSRCQQLS